MGCRRDSPAPETRGLFLRRLTVALAVTTMLAYAGLGVSVADASSMPAEGIFESCPIETAMAICVHRLPVMRNGGLNVVVFPVAQTSLAALSTYAAAAHWLGLSVMWATGDQAWWEDPSSSDSMYGEYQPFGAACGCRANGQILAYMIPWLGSLPGTYGYYAADDSMLGAGDRPGVANYVAEIKQQDPRHMVMIGAGDASQANAYRTIADTIGQEIYPVITSSLMPVSDNQETWGWVSELVSQTQHAADKIGKQSVFILQAFTWGDNLDDGEAVGGCTTHDTPLSCYSKLRYPSPAEQLQLRNEVLTHAHRKLILWWSFPLTYGQVGNETYSIYPTGMVAADRWARPVSCDRGTTATRKCTDIARGGDWCQCARAPDDAQNQQDQAPLKRRPAQSRPAPAS